MEDKAGQLKIHSTISKARGAFLTALIEGKSKQSNKLASSVLQVLTTDLIYQNDLELVFVKQDKTSSFELVFLD